MKNNKYTLCPNCGSKNHGYNECQLCGTALTLKGKEIANANS